MKNFIIIFFCSFLLLLTSCAEKTPTLKIQFKNKKGSIEQRSSIFYVSGNSRQLTVANYDLRSDKNQSDSANEIKTENQIKLVIFLHELNGQKNDFLKPSAYTFGKTENKSVTNAILYYFSGGKQQIETLSGGGKNDGVKITAKNGEMISGEININGKENKFIKGKFNAKIVKH